ncbi:TPA: hypothetical protein I7682_17665 [Vibrio vulnificus]|nr:hypothetical protein [Vibrio vulnificus]
MTCINDVVRYGPNGEFFSYKGHPLKNWQVAYNVLVNDRQGKASWRLPGWTNLNNDHYLSHLPYLSPEQNIIINPRTGRELENFKGVAMRALMPFYTYKNNAVRIWRVASVNEILTEFRRA